MDQETRIKYFPPNDLMFHHYLKEIDESHNDIIIHQIVDLNDAIELYNIAAYLKDARIQWRNWSKEEIDSCIKDFNNKAHHYISNLTTENFISQIENLFIDFFDDLATLLEQTTVYKNINKAIFQTEFYNKNYKLFLAVLRNKTLSKYYAQEIYNYFDSCVESAEVILNSVNHDEYHIPEIVQKNQEHFFERYINLVEPNYNFMITIQEAKFKYPISTKLKLLAKRKSDLLSKKYLKENHLFTTEHELAFVKGQIEKVKYDTSILHKIKITYSQDWIDNNSDNCSLIKNFVDMFEYIDVFGRINDIYKKNDDNFIEAVSEGNKGTYRINNAFEVTNNLSIVATNLYDSTIRKKGKTFEDLIKWFFSEYLINEYHLPQFRFNLPKEDIPYADKCQTLLASFESLLRQYKYFVLDKELDFDLITLDTQPVEIEKLPSFLNNKYIYGQGEEYRNITYLLFSDQSDIAHNQKVKRNYKSFTDLITDENLRKEDFLSFQIQRLDWLCGVGILRIDENGYLTFIDEEEVNIMFHLYTVGYIPYWNVTDFDRRKISELDKKGYIRYSSNFLAEQESDYFNYYLNKKFTNGLEIRNKYAHGIAQISESENEHYKDYLIIMKLIFIFLLKIDDEVKIYDKIKTLGIVNE